MKLIAAFNTTQAERNHNKSFEALEKIVLQFPRGKMKGKQGTLKLWTEKCGD